jgi:protein-S-isoprenylcysteine O-methyltransferase Ste14
MWNLLILIAGGLFLATLILTGILQRIADADVKGRPPVSRPLFLTGKAAMGLLWSLALWRAATAVTGPAAPASWADAAGAVLFAAGCLLAVAAFPVLGREIRFGLPEGFCRLKTGGLYAWSRHPMYTGFYLMAAGAGLFVHNAVAAVLFPLTVWVHHRVALAEERFMAKRFGAAWNAYARRVGRYGLLPGLAKAPEAQQRADSR